jgi:hypothetical protein
VQNQGLWVDIGKDEGPKCKVPENGIFRNYFCEEKVMDSVHGPWTTSGLGPRWTGHGRRHRAHRSSASGRSGVQGRWPRGGREGVGHGKLGGPLIGAREAVRRSGDGGEGSGGQNSGAECARAQGAGKWGQDVRGERAAAVVRHKGMKAAVLEGNRPGWWWGVMRSRCSDRYVSGGDAGRRRARTRDCGSGGRPGEEDDRARPARQ